MRDGRNTAAKDALYTFGTGNDVWYHALASSWQINKNWVNGPDEALMFVPRVQSSAMSNVWYDALASS
jgi:hypothetical protein